MTDSTPKDIPVKCQDCRKSSKPFIHDGCLFCQDLEFQEEVLCYLNQSSQNHTCFECHAYRPMLKLVTSDKKQNMPKSKSLSAKLIIEKQLNSEKVKYQKALALQKLTDNPEHEILDIKYHFILSTTGRKSIFAEPESAINFIDDVISNYSKTVGGFSYLLWLAPDHMHIY